MTGATSGIGAVAAQQLARAGARIVLIARDKPRGTAALAALHACSPGPHRLYFGDLSLIRDTRAVGAAIAADERRIDVLVNNAGALFAARSVTAEGLERTFATNHMSYFELTAQLRERLIASAPARIVNTASAAHRRARPDWSDLQSLRRYSGVQAYSRSKLYNILYTRELARRLEGTGVTANCFHPGFVATRFGDRSGGLTAAGLRILKLFAISPEEGAKTLLYLATANEARPSTGLYFYQSRPARTSPDAMDDARARALWQESERLAAAAAS